MMPTGMFTSNTQRQLQWSVMKPPAVGPTIEREAEHGTEQALRAAALVGREEVADDGEDGGEEHAAEEALDAAEDDQLGHVLGEPAERRGDDEADHAGEQERLAAEQVAELAGDRRHRGRGDQVGGGHPGVGGRGR